MSAQLEEVVADADRVDAQLFFPKGGQLRFHGIARSGNVALRRDPG